MKKIFAFSLIAISLISCKTTTSANNDKKLNILFIAVDDLKPLLGCYGDTNIITPNIDQLAERGTIFKNNHCQQSVCAPSRASLLTGQRPDKTKVWDLKTVIRDTLPDVVTLPQYLGNNGYMTLGIGKIYDLRSVDRYHDKKSWNVPYINLTNEDYDEGFKKEAFRYYQSEHSKELEKKLKEEAIKDGIPKHGLDGYLSNKYRPTTENIDVPDGAYTDGAYTNVVIKALDTLKNSTKPFFFALGYKKPHLPFNAPRKYWDMYDRNNIQLPEFQENSKNGFEFATQPGWEMFHYTDIDVEDCNNLEEAKKKELIHGYYAAVSYIDKLIGDLVGKLKETGLDKNTIICIWGDHGWHLGDHGVWCKHTNFEQATRSPLIIVDPRVNKKVIYNHPTEFVDVYPTLCELAGISIPDNLAGKSLAQVVRGDTSLIKKYAMSQYHRNLYFMGYSLRTKRYRYTLWLEDAYNNNKPVTPDMFYAKELFDYEKDPLEKVNLAGLDEYKKIEEELHAYMIEYFKKEGMY